MKFFTRNVLFGVVFITGAAVLVIEIVAVRILSPYYGNTIFSVSSVITVILAALSLGYYLGGKLADRRPSAKLFYEIILASGFVVLVLELVGVILLPYFGYRLSFVSGPLISAIILFFLPGFLLGMLSPFVIKLQKLRVPEEGVGTVAGKVFFWSTAGSIVGSLAAGFVLIPRFGVSEIMIATGATLAAIGLAGGVFAGARKEYEYMFLLALVAFALGGSLFSIMSATAKNVLYETDGIYEKLVVYDGQFQGRPTRFLRQDWSSASAMFHDSEDLVYDYTKYYKLYKVFNSNIKESLVIGAGAYSVPKILLQELPNVQVDVVDIEPRLLDIGKRFFRVSEDSRLTHYFEDGRRFLHDSAKQYDFVFSDVYVSSIPAHFATKEFFEIAESKLTNGGVFIANVIGDLAPRSPSFVLAEMKTFQSAFPQSYFFAVTSPNTKEIQNLMFVGHNSNRPIDFQSAAIKNHEDEFLRELSQKKIDVQGFELDTQPLLTDNFAPVEYLTAQIWKQRLSEER